MQAETDDPSPEPEFASGLVDKYGRVATDLRISVTDRCNFRCTYCMPAEGIAWKPHNEILSFEEITRLVKIFVELGVKKVRVTGGEPLVRRDIESLIAMLTEIPVPELAMTTNASKLRQKAGVLADAGLQRINVSLDSLRRERFEAIARFDGLDRVLDGLDAAREVGLDPIKVNCVVMRGVNDDELIDFAEFSRQTGYRIRFIEFMPLDGDSAWSKGKVVSLEEIVETISARYPLIEGDRPGPAAEYRFEDQAPGSIGVIASVTRPFCESCNRMRLTAEGQMLACLFALDDTDLRSLLRSGASDSEIAEAIKGTVAAKWAGHAIGNKDFTRPARSMSMIGG